jgi:hypothetical protein
MAKPKTSISSKVAKAAAVAQDLATGAAAIAKGVDAIETAAKGGDLGGIPQAIVDVRAAAAVVHGVAGDVQAHLAAPPSAPAATVAQKAGGLLGGLLSLADELFEQHPGDETHAVNANIGILKSALEAHPALSAK